MITDLEAAKQAYINHWHHCPGKQLAARSALIACECGITWPWEGPLGETMEWLETLEEVHRVGDPAQPVVEQPTLFG